MGVLSMSNQNSMQQNQPTSDENLKKFRSFNGLEVDANYRFEEPSFARNASISNDQQKNTSNARFANEFEIIENTPMKVGHHLII